MPNIKVVKCFLATIVIVSVATAQQIDYKGFPEWSWGKKDSTEYYLYTPSHSDKTNLYPLVVFLHGCCGEDYHATLRNAVDPPVRVWHNFGDNTQRTPTYILSPKTKVGWKQHFKNIKAVIDSLITARLADPQRIYIWGFSMGGQGTWQFIEQYPGYFAAAVPMGMDFKGNDPANFKDLPVWTVRGEKDWWARHLGTQVAAIRKLSSGETDSSEYITGVNPRLTTFKDMGHVVMWPAVNQLDLVNWTYSKINDGNRYPVVTLKSPAYHQQFRIGEKVELVIEAFDADDGIEGIDISLNGKKVKQLKTSPYRWSFPSLAGDMKIEVTAIDKHGKKTTASGVIWTDIKNNIIMEKLPDGQAGKFYSFVIGAKGNGAQQFSVSDVSMMPAGLELTKDGQLKGVPPNAGTYSIIVTATDEQSDVAHKKFALKIAKKQASDILVTHAETYAKQQLPISIVKHGVTPHIRSDNEVTFSGDLTDYENLTLIQTPINDTITAKPFYLRFETDEDVTVYVAYERLNNLYHSTIPAWLQEWQPEKQQLTAQYYYYDVYSRDFQKGLIELPDAEEKQNGVNTNYFVFVRKKQ
jgi:hypothetical protein